MPNIRVFLTIELGINKRKNCYPGFGPYFRSRTGTIYTGGAMALILVTTVVYFIISLCLSVSLYKCYN